MRERHRPGLRRGRAHAAVGSAHRERVGPAAGTSRKERAADRRQGDRHRARARRLDGHQSRGERERAGRSAGRGRYAGTANSVGVTARDRCADRGNPGRHVFRRGGVSRNRAQLAASCRPSNARRTPAHGSEDEARLRRHRAGQLPYQRPIHRRHQDDGGRADRCLRNRTGPSRPQSRAGRHGARSARVGRPDQRRGAHHLDDARDAGR